MKRFRLSRLACSAALVSLLFAIVTPLDARATLPGANGRIAFTANLRGSWQIYTMNPNGAAVRQVTHLAGSTDTSMFPSRSPDGRRLAFSSSVSGNAEIYTINIDGTGLRQVTSNPADELAPAWSPDGRRIAFERVSGFEPSMWSMNPDGSQQRRLTGDSFLPTYTPDDRHIVFVSSRGGLVAAVWIMNADGSSPRRLTSPRLEGTPWDVSPDGRHILLGDHQNTVLATSILVMNLDGSGLRRLTRAGCCFHDANARYSPDGTKIVFTTDRSFAARGIREDEIWEMNADGTNMHPLTSSVTLGGCPGDLVVNCVGPPDWGRR